VLGVGVQRSTEPGFVLLPLGPPRRRGVSPRQNKVVKFHLTRQAAASTGYRVYKLPRLQAATTLQGCRSLGERQI